MSRESESTDLPTHLSNETPFRCSVQICRHSVGIYSQTDHFLQFFQGKAQKDYTDDIPGWGVLEYPIEGQPKVVYKSAEVNNFSYFPNSKTLLVKASEADIQDGQALAYLSYWLTEGERQRDSNFSLHAAALSVENRGILLLGYRGAGKTSTLLNLAKKYNGELIANDLCILSHDAKEQQVVLEEGTKKVRLRLRSVLNSFPELVDHFPDTKRPAWTTKVLVEPDLLGIRLAQAPKVLSQAFIVHLSSIDDNGLIVKRVQGIEPYFELYENLARIIRGSAITIFCGDENILGYIPSLETEQTHQNKVDLLNHLIKERGIWSVSGGNLDKICDKINEITQKES